MASFMLLQSICHVAKAQDTPNRPEMRDTVPRITLHVVLDPEMQFIDGVAHVQNTKNDAMLIKTTGIEIKSARFDDNPSLTVNIERDFLTAPAYSQLTISFQKKLQSPAELSGNFSDDDFLALTGNWCPEAAIPAQYDLEVTAPMELTAVSEANQIKEQWAERNRTTIFYFPYPRFAPALVIGKYTTESITVDGITLQTYFLSPDKGLSETYLNKTAHYLNLYKGLLGRYPFRRFAVVENKAPTGFGHATFTLLGSDVLRLPFIADTSLGHEFVHTWFGNSVYVDYQKGNWCEGLTTYLSDYLYSDLKQQGKEHRKRILTEYQSYVHEQNAISASEFVSQQGRAARAAGYGKVAMFFYMLRTELGDEVFWGAIRKFIEMNMFMVASWDEIRMAFETVAKKDLSVTFEQWVKRNDAPAITVKPTDNLNVLSPSIIVEQMTETPYGFSLPIRLHTPTGDRDISAQITGKSQEIALGPGLVNSITIDPDYHVMRKLDELEFAPVLARLFGADKKVAVVNESDMSVFQPALNFFKVNGFEITTADTTKVISDAASGYSMLFLGRACSQFARLTGQQTYETHGTGIEIFSHPFSETGVIGCFTTTEPAYLEGIMPKLSHYGKYSMLQFEGTKNVKKEIARTNEGIKLELSPPFWAITDSGRQDFAELINRLKAYQVVFVGEKHDDFSHHLAQLEVIRGLNEKGVSLAVGMEMFQRPFQVALERYIKKEISEPEFLRQSEFLGRWGYDYALYRPILSYCRENSIPVVALNLEKEVSQEVGQKGLQDVLATAQADLLPNSIDWSNLEQKKWLEEIYAQHPQNEIKDAASFYQAQIMWDETMAETIAEYLRTHSEKQMVVLAGIGHVANGYGIPPRLKRRLGNKDNLVFTIAPVSQGYQEHEAGDAILFAPPVAPPFSAKLGIVADDKTENAVVIKEVMPESVADKAGLKAGDTLMKADGMEITGIFALRSALVLKNEGDALQLQVKKVDGSVEDKMLVMEVVKSPHGNMAGVVNRNGMQIPHKKETDK